MPNEILRPSCHSTLGYIILGNPNFPTPGTPLALTGFKSCAVSQNFIAQLLREQVVNSISLPTTRNHYIKWVLRTKSPIKSARIGENTQIVDILCRNTPRFQNCQNFWIRPKIGPSRAWKRPKRGHFSCFSPLLTLWQPREGSYSLYIMNTDCTHPVVHH